MKICSKCNQNYSDETLEFCLNDGTRLTKISEKLDEPATILSGSITTTDFADQSENNQQFFQSINSAQTLTNQSFQSASRENAQTQLNDSFNENFQINKGNQQDSSKKQKGFVSRTGDKILSIVPIVFALAQNYWQWLYLIKPDAFVFPGFLWSFNFIVWLLLLIIGVTLCVLAIKRDAGKSLAITGLIILAINFLLCLVPRHE